MLSNSLAPSSSISCPRSMDLCRKPFPVPEMHPRSQKLALGDRLLCHQARSWHQDGLSQFQLWASCCSHLGCCCRYFVCFVFCFCFSFVQGRGAVPTCQQVWWGIGSCSLPLLLPVETPALSLVLWEGCQTQFPALLVLHPGPDFC